MYYIIELNLYINYIMKFGDKWGPTCWIFFHCLAERIKEESFKEMYPIILQIIKDICAILPCPDCRMHAIQNIRRARLDLITSKDNLVNFLFEFHNLVNKQTRKQEYSKDVLKKYDDLETGKVVNEFAYTYSTVSSNVKLMTDNFHRQRFLVWLREYLINNGRCFKP